MRREASRASEAAAAAGARWNLLVQQAWMDESSPRILTDIAKKALLATDLFLDVGYSLYPDVPPEYMELLKAKKTRRMTLECRTLRRMIGGGADRLQDRARDGKTALC